MQWVAPLVQPLRAAALTYFWHDQVLLKETNEDGEPTLRWNVQWNPEKIRLVFPSSTSRMTRKESTSAKKAVEVDRSFQVDAAIVRIMKMRKRLSHTELVAEVRETKRTYRGLS
jgi:hypothetical protein